MSSLIGVFPGSWGAHPGFWSSVEKELTLLSSRRMQSQYNGMEKMDGMDFLTATGGALWTIYQLNYAVDKIGVIQYRSPWAGQGFESTQVHS